MIFRIHLPSKQIACTAIMIPSSTSHHVDFQLQISNCNITRKSIYFHNCHRSDSFLHWYLKMCSYNIIHRHQQILLRRCLIGIFFGVPKYQTLQRSLDIYIISKIKWDLTNGPLIKFPELSNGDFLDYRE